MAPLADTDVVIVEAVRSPLGRRNGGLSTVHPADLLGHVQTGAIERSGIDPHEVGQLVGGCVSQVGEQTFNIARTAWLAAGMPLEVAATTVDAQCGSSQQATNLATSLIKAGAVEVALSCGVESMSRVPLGAAVRGDFGRPTPKSYFAQYEVTSQFEGAERIADKWGVTREDCDRFGLESQTRAQRAWAEGRFEREVLPVDAPDVGEDGKPTGSTHEVARDEGLRETSLEALAKLKPVGREDGVHTAGSSSQITDGAAAVLLMTAAKAQELGLTPRARIVDQCLVGVDPVLMLTGPIDATRRLLERTGPGHGRHRHRGDQRSVRVRRPGVGARAEAGHGEGESERRGDRPRSPGGRDRGPPRDDRAPRARAHRRHLRAHHDVLRWWARYRHHHRAGLIGAPSCPRTRS